MSMTTIDRKQVQIVDLSTCAPIEDAVAVDLDARQVTIIEHEWAGNNTTDRPVVRYYPAGIKLIRRP